jgi:hypothetical protein
VTTEPDPNPEVLRAELAEQRAELADTVAELTDRVNVPARVKARTAETAEQARRMVAEKTPVVQQAVRDRPVTLAAVAGSVLLLGVASIVRRRRSASLPTGAAD